MNIITHQLDVYSPFGVAITSITDPGLVTLAYALKDNAPSVLEFTVVPSFDINLIPIEAQIEVYRTYGLASPVLEGDTAFFVRQRIKTDDGIKVTAYSACEILQRRLIAYYAGTSYADKASMPWDDMAREFVDQNMGPGATDTARSLDPWLTIEADLGLGASTYKSAAWRNLLDVLQEIAEEVHSNGSLGSFDVVRVTPGHYEFRVFVGPRGSDHRQNSGMPVIVSKQRKNLVSPVWNEDWTNECNFIYGTGQGQQTERIVMEVSDDERIAIGPFNRREYNRDSRQAGTPEGVQADAQAALDEFRPTQTFEGYITQTEGCIYDVHWKWGDIVTAEDSGRQADCYVSAVVVNVDPTTGGEQVEGFLRSVSNVI